MDCPLISLYGHKKGQDWVQERKGEMKTMSNMINTLEFLPPHLLESCFLRIIGKVVKKEKY
jgi:hypothetical protein